MGADRWRGDGWIVALFDVLRYVLESVYEGVGRARRAEHVGGVRRGAIMGGGSSGGGDSTQTSTVRTVPDWAIPFVTSYWTTGYALWKSDTLSVYTGDVTADQPLDETDGIAGLANRGRYGDQVISKAIAYENDAINGGYLAGTKAAFLTALASVTDKSTLSFASVNSRVGRKPYYVGDADTTFLAQTFITGTPTTYNARMSALIYADNFHKERVLQDHALSYGVEMGKHAAIDAEALRRAGLYSREYLQGTYGLDHKLFVEGQEIAVANLEIMGNCIRGLTGSQQTSDQQMSGGSKLMGVASGAITGAVGGYMAGAYLGAEYGVVGGPWGMAIGAVVGGIAGYFMS
jgi:hypothetical protein